MVKSSRAVKKAASAQITTNRCFLHAFSLKGGTTASSALFKDGGASGTEKWAAFIKAQTAAGDDTVNVTFPTPIEFTSGLYVTLAGTDAAVYVAYSEVT